MQTLSFRPTTVSGPQKGGLDLQPSAHKTKPNGASVVQHKQQTAAVTAPSKVHLATVPRKQATSMRTACRSFKLAAHSCSAVLVSLASLDAVMILFNAHIISGSSCIIAYQAHGSRLRELKSASTDSLVLITQLVHLDTYHSIKLASCVAMGGKEWNHKYQDCYKQVTGSGILFELLLPCLILRIALAG